MHCCVHTLRSRPKVELCAEFRDNLVIYKMDAVKEHEFGGGILKVYCEHATWAATLYQWKLPRFMTPVFSLSTPPTQFVWNWLKMASKHQQGDGSSLVLLGNLISFSNNLDKFKSLPFLGQLCVSLCTSWRNNSLKHFDCVIKRLTWIVSLKCLIFRYI